MITKHIQSQIEFIKLSQITQSNILGYKQGYWRSILQSLVDRPGKDVLIATEQLNAWNFGMNSSGEKIILTIEQDNTIVKILLYINDSGGDIEIKAEKILLSDGKNTVKINLETFSFNSSFRYYSIHEEFVTTISKSAMISFHFQSNLRRKLFLRE